MFQRCFWVLYAPDRGEIKIFLRKLGKMTEFKKNGQKWSFLHVFGVLSPKTWTLIIFRGRNAQTTPKTTYHSIIINQIFQISVKMLKFFLGAEGASKVEKWITKICRFSIFLGRTIFFISFIPPWGVIPQKHPWNVLEDTINTNLSFNRSYLLNTKIENK